MERLGTTLSDYIRHRERLHPEATGEFSMLLGAIGVAAKIISREVNRAGVLEDVLGLTGQTNVQGEQVQKLDDYANETFVRMLERSGAVAIMGSEEVEGAIPGSPGGRYAVLFDPLDGSSNVDIAAPIGTIFSIHRRERPEAPADHSDLLRPGAEQVAAGYVLYGSSTLLVYSAGNGVNGFTLDPTVGEFLHSHESLRIPDKGSSYSVNEGNEARWSKGDRELVRWLKQDDKATGRPYGLRYIGALVADFHRTLLRGGIYAYPADSKSPRGKLRYLYEAAPLAFLAEQAGGAATSGVEPILGHRPQALHERTPLYIGSREDVALAARFLGDGA